MFFIYLQDLNTTKLLTMKKAFGLVIICFLSSHASAQSNLVNPNNIDISYKKFILNNGLTLVVHEDHKAPIVAVNVWYHVGSKK